VEIVGAEPGSRWDCSPTYTGDHRMALRTALSFVQEMEKELGAALLIRITGPDYDGTPLNAAEIRSAMFLFGTTQDRLSMLASN